MSVYSRGAFARALQGQLLRHSERREVAIFVRDDALWVADFIDGEGTLVDAVTWFRFNCGAAGSPHARRRMVLESAIPLSDEMVARIGRLPAPRLVARPPRTVRAWWWRHEVAWGDDRTPLGRRRAS
jgi:hypothetical protein